MDNYILIGHEPVPEPDLIKWGRWFGRADRRVLRDEFPNGVVVSTVFLGMDHGWGEGPPLLFETMIFGRNDDSYQTRCSTWDEAIAMHMQALQYLRSEGPE
jgi:hypothetical protein